MKYMVYLVLVKEWQKDDDLVVHVDFDDVEFVLHHGTLTHLLVMMIQFGRLQPLTLNWIKLHSGG